MTITEYLDKYNPGGVRPVTELQAERSLSGSPFIVIRHGKYAVLIDPLVFDDHLSIDITPFIDEQPAIASAFGMTLGRQWELEETGKTSFGRPAANVITVIVSEQP